MKKQTAVSWLEKRADEREKNNPNEHFYWHLRELQKDFEQAKEMEKQQHSETWDNSLIENKGDNYIGKEKSFEEYYKDTFKDMKKTAVEWLVEKMLVCNYINKKQYDNCKSWLLQEAKEMEKQQIVDAHLDGQSLVSCKDEYAEQYYNDTFKNK